ncbi:M24 family metallopeptidase [Halopenitus salinus]|uniref:M24 family metallopeptidase n=1 Tax=Halopenitus salinus TaxID=1198295 RepID=A0ABD5V002_9EURY
MTGSEVASGSAPVETGLTAIAERLADGDADALVVVGDRFDSDLRYLSRAGTFDGRAAIAVSEDDAVLCPPAVERFDSSVSPVESRFRRGRATNPIDRSVRPVDTDDGAPVGERAAAAVTELVGSGADVVVPRTLPHDAAVYLKQAGHSIASTTAVREARTTKSDAEIDRLRTVQTAATAAMGDVAAIVAESTVASDASGSLCWREEPLSAERLRREADAALARAGVDPAGNTMVEGSQADRNVLRAGDPIVVSIAPRGPVGYHGALTRTFVVDGDGGWERRAHVAGETAGEMAVDAADPGVRVAVVSEEISAEVGAYGFDPAPGESGSGAVAVVHGVGLDRREPPSVDGETELRAGTVLAVEAGVRDRENGSIRLRDLMVVRESGGERIGECPSALAPERY